MKKITSIGLITLSMAGVASAAPNPNMLVGYDFDTGADVYTAAATYTASNIAASTFTTGSGLNDVAATQTGSTALDAEGYDFGTANDHNFGGLSSVFDFGTGGDNPSTLADAITWGDYMTFNVTLTGDFDLTSFTYRSFMGANASRRANEYALFSDVTGSMVQVSGASATGTSAGGWDNNIVTLGNEFEGVSGTIVFQLYIYGRAGTSNRGNEAIFDKVVLNGVAVPESGTYALLAGCLALTSVMVRRRK